MKVGASWWLLVSVGLLGQACSCGPRRSPSSEPPSTAPRAAVGAGARGSSSPAALTTVAVDPASGLPTLPAEIPPLLGDPSLPELAKVREAIERRDTKAAADALAAAVAALPNEHRDRAWFMLARLYESSKQDAAAESAYAAITADSPLRPYAVFRRTVCLARLGRNAAALALFPELPSFPHLESERNVLEGDVRSAQGDHAGAITAFGREAHGTQWALGSVRFAEEVAAAGESSRASECVAAARRVRFEVPSSPLVPRAEAAERTCRVLLGKAEGADVPPTSAERLASGRAFLDGAKPKEAMPLLSLVRAEEKRGSALWCRATLLAARAQERQRSRKKASELFGEAEAHCTDEDTRLHALWEGGKSALAQRDTKLGRERLARLEAAFPHHRLADDARLKGAVAALDAGDAATAESMLSSLADTYPQGDMRTEALFRLALPHLRAGEYAKAIPWLERSVALAPHEDDYFLAGRAAYFLALARLRTGATEAGLAGLRAVVVHEPLTFAAALAYGRLCAHGPEECKKAREALDAAWAAEPASPPLYDAHRPEIATDAFVRGIELARVAEPELARKEFKLAGLGGKGSAPKPDIDPEGTWLVSHVLARTGNLRASHQGPRGSARDWATHFPGGRYREAWELAFPRVHRELVEEHARNNGISPMLVWAVMREESAFDADVVSPANAYGLMQLIVPTAQGLGAKLGLPSDARSLTIPAVNIALGTSYLSKLHALFPERPLLSVPSYNAGEGATQRWMKPPLAEEFDLWVELIPYEETRRYTKRVLASYISYVALYDRDRLYDALRSMLGATSPR